MWGPFYFSTIPRPGPIPGPGRLEDSLGGFRGRTVGFSVIGVNVAQFSSSPPGRRITRGEIGASGCAVTQQGALLRGQGLHSGSLFAAWNPFAFSATNPP